MTPLPLVGPDDLRLLGSYRLPTGTSGGSSFGYAGPFAFDPDTGTMFAVGHDWQQHVAEYAIPELRLATTAAGLLRATVLQPFSDPTDGTLPLIDPGEVNAKKLGGLLPWGDRLILSAYSYYDGSGNAVASHFVSPRDLSGTASGPYRFTAAPGVVGGYMARVPERWRAALGGPALTGIGGIPIIGRSSLGPSLFVFNPDDLGVVDPVPAIPLLFYPSTHPLGEWNQQSELFNGTTRITGVVIPNGSRSVLFFGMHGIGPFCYGDGTRLEPAPAGACYDPELSSKGNHAYPYVYRVWAYDLLDLIAVKEGRMQPWEPRPYATWDLTFPTPRNVTGLNGATYDEATGRVFIGQSLADGERPVIHVYEVGAR